MRSSILLGHRLLHLEAAIVMPDAYLAEAVNE